MHWNQGAVIRGELSQIEAKAIESPSAEPAATPTAQAKRNAEPVRAAIVREIARDSNPEKVVSLVTAKA